MFLKIDLTLDFYLWKRSYVETTFVQSVWNKLTAISFVHVEIIVGSPVADDGRLVLNSSTECLLRLWFDFDLAQVGSCSICDVLIIDWTCLLFFHLNPRNINALVSILSLKINRTFQMVFHYKRHRTLKSDCIFLFCAPKRSHVIFINDIGIRSMVVLLKIYPLRIVLVPLILWLV